MNIFTCCGLILFAVFFGGPTVQAEQIQETLANFKQFMVAEGEIPQFEGAAVEVDLKIKEKEQRIAQIFNQLMKDIWAKGPRGFWRGVPVNILNEDREGLGLETSFGSTQGLWWVVFTFGKPDVFSGGIWMYEDVRDGDTVKALIFTDPTKDITNPDSQEVTLFYIYDVDKDKLQSLYQYIMDEKGFNKYTPVNLTKEAIDLFNLIKFTAVTYIDIEKVAKSDYPEVFNEPRNVKFD
jgi:hypothetical protein